MLPTERPGYRSDIDGLRALAILPVLLTHARVPGVTGGYVGVDVFFVISGFLITGIITREIDANTFSLSAFYERRVRRILPALFAVVAFVLIAASLLYLPGDFEGVPKSALAALLFSANFWFFSQTGYFQSGTDTMPLLHTWSLGVEEQFYFVFPIVMMVMTRFGARWRVAVMWLAAIIGFALAVRVQARVDGLGFYLLPARAWELLAGVILALGAIPQVPRGVWREMLAWAGLALILVPVMLYDETTVFPGAAALPPVTGAALLLHCAPCTRVGTLLSLRGPVFIGAISYSLYLWHWPLIVFAEYVQDAPLSLGQSAIAVCASIGIAWLSWRFVEAPFRDPQRMPQKRVFAVSAASLAILCAAATGLTMLGTWPGRFSDATVTLTQGKFDVSPMRSTCLTVEIGAARSACTLGAAVSPSELFWGDSHGVELAWARSEILARSSGALAQRTRAGCPPVAGWHSPLDPECARFNTAVLDEIENSPGIKRVFLAAFWVDDRYRKPGTMQNFERTLIRLQRAGKQVVVIAPVPQQSVEVPRYLAHRSVFGGMDAPVPGSSAKRYADEAHWVRRRFDSWEARGVVIMDPARALVDGGSTRIVSGGKPLYFDTSHLSLAGARLVLRANPEI